MADPYMSEIRIMPFNFPPKGWAFCNGQFMPINQNQALFLLLGTTYGGNGQTTFALPNLQGRTPVHVGSGYTIGQSAGEESYTLTQSEMPTHTHVMQASALDGNAPVPGPTNVLARSVNNIYGPPTDLAAMNPATISSVGNSQPHENRQPFLTLSFCIALIGVFPSRN